MKKITKKKEKIWRLHESPTTENILKLVDAGIISTEQADRLIFREEEVVERNQVKELRDEIRVLRELVLALSSKFPTVTYPIVIREVEPYKPLPWTNPWITWCGSTSNSQGSSSTLTII